MRLLRDVIRRVQSQDWMNVLGIAEGTASIATGRASPSLPAPPTSHLARELAPGTGEAAGAAGEGGLMLPPGLASEEQASADRSHPRPARVRVWIAKCDDRFSKKCNDGFSGCSRNLVPDYVYVKCTKLRPAMLAMLQELESWIRTWWKSTEARCWMRAQALRGGIEARSGER